jgi:hypothetical protein
VQPFMFDTGAKRRLQQTSASYQRSDRMQMAGMATQVSYCIGSGLKTSNSTARWRTSRAALCTGHSNAQS